MLIQFSKNTSLQEMDDYIELDNPRLHRNLDMLSVCLEISIREIAKKVDNSFDFGGSRFCTSKSKT